VILLSLCIINLFFATLQTQLNFNIKPFTFKELNMTTIKSVHESKIDWCTHTCNIITGCLGPAGDGQQCQTPEGNDYCYAKPFANRIYRKPLGKGKEFEPHFWRERIPSISIASAGARIFMNSMGDAFGDWIPAGWIDEMLTACAQRPDITFYFLTKNPKRYFEQNIREFFEKNDNFWTGFTAETGELYKKRWRQYPRPGNHFVSIEPMFDGRHILELDGPNEHPLWVIVGGRTNPTFAPPIEWIANIRKQCEILSIPLFEKGSLKVLDLPGGLIQEIP
jgi:protein gp37